MEARRLYPVHSAVVLLLAGFVDGCSKSPGAAQEVARIPSPHQQIEMVVTEVDTGATTPTVFEVFILPRGRAPTQEDLVLKVDKSSQPRVGWVSPTAAVISCDDGRVWHFQNFASVKLAERQFSTISISLACGEHGYKRQ